MARRRPGIAVLLALAALLPVVARAQNGEAQVQQAAVVVRDGWLVARVQLSSLIDRRTASTIDSGLPGVCAYEVALRGPGDRLLERITWTVRLEHDVWEDRYRVRGPDGTREVSSIAAMDSAIARLQGVLLAPLSDLAAEERYRLEVAVEVLPLGAEAEDRLGRYLSRRGGGSREELDVDLGSLFSRVFGGGGGDGGRTRVAWVGPPFRPGELRREPGDAAEGSP